MKRSQLAYLSLLALATIVLCSADAMAQFGGGRGGRGGFGGGGFGGPGGGGMAGLLMTQEVRDELEITDDQVADLQAMGEDMREEVRAMFEGMRDVPEEERGERFAQLRGEIEEMTEERMNEVLLPHQMKRLKEINVQQQVQRGGLNGALSGRMAEELGITDEQREEMVAKAQELQQEMQEKIAKMRADAEEELKGLLTAEQREKLETMMGSKFDMPEPQFGGRGGFGQGGERGQRGERGGRGGRGGRPQAE